jgi:NAD-dependent SIR2 family protein deacetylase
MAAAARQSRLEQQLDQAASLLRDSDAVLISAGAGMSVPAGVDYYDREFFARHYPAMVKRGFSYCYELIGHPALMRDPRLSWGYSITHANAVGSVPAPHPVYTSLRKLVDGKDHFVVTTNADGLFTRPESVFERHNVFTPQGSWRFVQCLRPCADDSVFDSEPFIRRLLPLVDPETMQIPEKDIPKCPRCDGPMFFNVNGGQWYRSTAYAADAAAYHAFMAPFKSPSNDATKRLLIVEIGVGWNTPGVLRFPNEELLEQNPHVSLVRINLDDEAAEVPEPAEAQNRAVGLAMPLESVLQALLQRKAVQRANS